jgi:hypothetical protein
LNTTLTPHSIIHGDACFAYFNKLGHPASPVSHPNLAEPIPATESDLPV